MRRFRTQGNTYYETIRKILDENEARIVKECQAYLDAYERSGKPRFAVDIDRIIGLMDADSLEDDSNDKRM